MNLQQFPARIIDYAPLHKTIFRDLNLAWIERYFEVEEMDRVSLDDPDHHIIEAGGAILMAEHNGQIVGTCALLKMTEGCYELAKMAVSPEAHGKGVGWALGLAVIERARALGATRLFLESNTLLKPAISLYRKLGFEPVTDGPPSPYSRANIQMQLILERDH